MVQHRTVPSIRAAKGGPPVVMVTAYDAPTARIADDAGVDVILVGDSVAMVVLGYDDTLQVTVADMAHHVGAVARARPRALVVADMPWLSYHLSAEEAVRNAAVLIRAGASAVKLEGGRERVAVVEALVDAQIPVMGHLGLTPQSVHAMGGYRVQGQQADSAAGLIDDARALAGAGCFAVVLECVPREVARLVTAAVPVPTIGIGAGPDCDGQVLVLHDLLGLEDRPLPRFVRRYATVKADAVAAVAAYAGDVRSGAFPSDAESYHLTDEVAAALGPSGPAERGARGAGRGAAHGMNIRVLRWVIAGLLAVGGVAFLAVGANGPADPTLRAADGPVSLPRTPFGDFGEIGFRVEGGAAATAARCALLAETASQQALGLMNRTDLAGYDGMLFSFASDTTAAFYMKDTPLPLSIAFFDGSGAFVSTADMAPCIHMASCPTYAAARPYRWALEVPQGALPRLAIGPGTRLVAGGPCP